MQTFKPSTTKLFEDIDPVELDEFPTPDRCDPQCDNTDIHTAIAPDDESTALTYTQEQLKNLLGFKSATLVRNWINEINAFCDWEDEPMPNNGYMLKLLRKRQALTSNNIPDPAITPSTDTPTQTIPNPSKQPRQAWLDYLEGLRPATPAEIVLSQPNQGATEIGELIEDWSSQAEHGMNLLRSAIADIGGGEGQGLAQVFASATVGEFKAQYAQALADKIPKAKREVDTALLGG